MIQLKKDKGMKFINGDFIWIYAGNRATNKMRKDKMPIGMYFNGKIIDKFRLADKEKGITGICEESRYFEFVEEIK